MNPDSRWLVAFQSDLRYGKPNKVLIFVIRDGFGLG